MTTEPNFAAILDRPAADIERPPAFPAGSYRAVVTKLPKFGQSTKKKTDYAEFELKPLEAMDDVDEDALKDFGGLGDKTIQHTFYLTEKSAYRLKEFLMDDLQIDEGDSLRDMIDQSPGRECIIHVKHTPSDDGKGVFANISSTAPVDA